MAQEGHVVSLVKLCQWLGQYGPSVRRRLAGQVAPNGAFTTTDLMRNVHKVGALLAKLLYHEKVLSAYYDLRSCGLVTNKERSCGSGGGQFILMIYGLLAPASTVWVTDEEKAAIKERADEVGMYRSGYLRARGLNTQIRSVVDLTAVADLAKVKGDLGRSLDC